MIEEGDIPWWEYILTYTDEYGNPIEGVSAATIEYGCKCKKCGEFYEYVEKKADYVCKSCKSYEDM